MRFCNDVTCVNLNDGNKTNLTGISTIYEIGSEKLNINPLSFFQANFNLILLSILIILLAFFILKRK